MYMVGKKSYHDCLRPILVPANLNMDEMMENYILIHTNSFALPLIFQTEGQVENYIQANKTERIAIRKEMAY